MNPPRLLGHFVLCACLVFPAASGCVTYQRDAFLQSHSLDRFAADRPQAGRLLDQHPALKQWLLTEWNRPIAGYRIHWSGEKPVASLTAEHGFMPDYQLIVIRVSKKLSPVDQLLSLTYEVCNAQGFSDIEALNARAVAGTVTRQEYINELNAREHAALLRVKEFFPKLLPLSRDEVADTIVYRALLEVPDDFHEYEAWSIRVGSIGYLENQKRYGQQYDRLNRKTHP